MMLMGEGRIHAAAHDDQPSAAKVAERLVFCARCRAATRAGCACVRRTRRYGGVRAATTQARTASTPRAQGHRPIGRRVRRVRLHALARTITR